jgi:hypothetical protein
VGRVFSRYGHRGRPLNSVVRAHQMRQLSITTETIDAAKREALRETLAASQELVARNLALEPARESWPERVEVRGQPGQLEKVEAVALANCLIHLARTTSATFTVSASNNGPIDVSNWNALSKLFGATERTFVPTIHSMTLRPYEEEAERVLHGFLERLFGEP